MCEEQEDIYVYNINIYMYLLTYEVYGYIYNIKIYLYLNTDVVTHQFWRECVKTSKKVHSQVPYVCCSMLQCVAVCCQCVKTSKKVHSQVACVSTCCSALHQYVATWCSAFSVCRSVMQCIHISKTSHIHKST